MRFETIGKTKAPLFISRGHSHALWELCYNIKGNGTIVMGEESFHFKAGSIALCPPGMSHAKTSEDGFEDCYV